MIGKSMMPRLPVPRSVGAALSLALAVPVLIEPIALHPAVAKNNMMLLGVDEFRRRRREHELAARLDDLARRNAALF